MTERNTWGVRSGRREVTVVIWLATTQHSRRLLNACTKQSQNVQNTELILQQKHTITRYSSALYIGIA